jgi:hypothetical protein
VIEGNPYCESTALAELTLNFNRSLMLINDPSSYGQSQTRATHAPRSHLVSTPETIKYVQLIGLRNTDSGIGYLDCGRPIPCFNADVDPSPFGRVFDRIVYRIYTGVTSPEVTYGQFPRLRSSKMIARESREILFFRGGRMYQTFNTSIERAESRSSPGRLKRFLSSSTHR